MLTTGRNAPNAAKSDLKRQLKNFKVRPAIEQAIVKELVPTSSASSTQPDTADELPVSSRNLAASVSSLSTDRPVTPGPDNRAEPVEPMYVNTQRELDDIFREMHSYFEGRETEQNWLKREESMTKLRRLLAGNAASDFHDSFLSALRALLDGIIKAVVSLRTSLSKEGCALVQDIARIYGPAMDPMVEILMQTFIKLCAATKKIASQQANAVVDTIIGRVTYNKRIMEHIWLACQDKNVQPRLYATGWLKTVVLKESHHKSHVEHSGGLDLIEKCLKKGLADANPGVREKMRATYWAFAGIWPVKAEAIMSGLDSTAQRLLEKDPNNPNSPKRTEGGTSRPGLGLSKSTIGPPKPSLREAMLAQKKAMASNPKTLPVRPGSAMSHFSPTRTASNLSTASAATTTTTSTVRTRGEGTGTLGGISGAPVRPGRRRPEMTARPATAGPYSVRSHDQPSVEHTSPQDKLKSKATTPKSIATSPKRTATRIRPSHAATNSESSIPTPTKSTRTTASPRTTPSRPRLASPSTALSSPSKPHEELTLLVPGELDSKPQPSQQVPQEHAQQRDVTELSRQISEELLQPPSQATSLVSSQGTSQESLQQLQQDLPAEIPLPDTRQAAEEVSNAIPAAGSPPVRVYEDPQSAEQEVSKPTYTGPVLEDKPVNEDAATLQRSTEGVANGAIDGAAFVSPEKTKQNARLLESGITKVKQKSLDVHGFRKLQGIIRDNKSASVFTDDKFDALLSGLFEYLESPLTQIQPEKVQDVKAQILATIKLLLKHMRDNFQPHVSRGLESLLRARAAYDGRTHVVSGLELLADELVTIGDASEITVVLTGALGRMEVDAPQPNSGALRSLSMGLHVLKEMVDQRGPTFVPSEAELTTLVGLAARCLESIESAVRMDAVQLCVALHARVGDVRFWAAMKGVKDDPKSLITYYIVKRQRETGNVAGSTSVSSGSVTGGSVPSPASSVKIHG